MASSIASGGAQDPGDGFHEVVDDCRRLHPIVRSAFLGFSVPRTNEHTARANPLPGFDIVPSIADDERSIERDIEIGRSLPEEPGLRFPALTGLSIPLDHRLWMVRAVVEPFHPRAAGREATANVLVRFGDECFLEDSAGDARLIGHHDD